MVPPLIGAPPNDYSIFVHRTRDNSKHLAKVNGKETLTLVVLGYAIIRHRHEISAALKVFRNRELHIMLSSLVA